MKQIIMVSAGSRSVQAVVDNDQELLVVISGDCECQKQDPARLVELSHDLEIALAKIGEREAKIIRLRYLTDKSMTHGEIGKRLGISGCRVQQLEERALLRLRRVAAKLGLIE